MPRYTGQRSFIAAIKPVVGVRAGKISTIKIVIEGADTPPDTDSTAPTIKTTVKKLPNDRWRVVTVATDENGEKRRQTFTIDPKKIKRSKTFEAP